MMEAAKRSQKDPRSEAPALAAHFPTIAAQSVPVMPDLIGHPEHFNALDSRSGPGMTRRVPAGHDKGTSHILTSPKKVC